MVSWIYLVAALAFISTTKSDCSDKEDVLTPFLNTEKALHCPSNMMSQTEVNTMPRFKAVLIGATGATGKFLLAELVKAKEFSEIVSVGRRRSNLTILEDGVDLRKEEDSGRVQQHIIDMESVTQDQCKEYFEGKDVFFTTLGTTRRQAGSAEAFRHIDFDYNYKFAKAAKDAGVRMMSLMSSQGAKASSYFLYLKTKGELDLACAELKFPQLSIFQPGFLDRGENERLIEKLSSFFVSRIPTETVARGMVSDALLHLKEQLPPTPRISTLYNAEIRHLSDTLEIGQE